MIRRSLLTVGAALSALAVTALATFAQTPPPIEAERHLPAAKTLAVLTVTDWKAAEGAFQGTDLGAVWRTLESFRAELHKGLDVSMADAKRDFEKETGVPMERALEALSGGVTVAVVDVAPPEAKQPQPGFLVGFSPAHKATVEAMYKKAFPAPPPGEPSEPPPFALVDRPGTCFIVQDVGQGKALLAADGEKTLADDAAWKGVKARASGGGVPAVHAFVNAGPLLTRVTAHDAKAKEDLGKAGLLAVQALGLSVGFADGKLRECFTIWAPGARTGALAALSGGTPLDVASLARTAPADAFSFAALRFDLKGALDAVVDIAAAFDPNARKEYQEGLAEFEKELGVKLHEDILATLGDTWTMATFVPQDGLLPEVVTAVPLKDAARFEATLAKLCAKANLQVKTTQRAGRAVRYLQAPLGKVGQDPTRNEEALAMALGLTTAVGCYAVEGGTLYTAALPQALEDHFERAAKGHLSDQDAFKAALARAPQGARYFGWGRTRPTAGIVYHIALKVLRAAEPALRQAGVPVDTALLPRPGIFASPWLPACASFTADGEAIALVMQGGTPTLSLIPPIAAAVIPSYLEQREMQARFEVENRLREVFFAQQSYFAEKNKYATSIEELVSANVLMGFQPVKGYSIVISKVEGSAFLVEARPMDPRKPHLIVDESGAVRGFGEPNPYATPPEPPQDPQAPPPGESEGGGK